MNYSDLIAEDIRLVILKALAEDTGYSQNESIIQRILEMFGHRVSRDRVRTELCWLSENGLVTLEKVVNIYVAAITRRGLDTAKGRSVVLGVKRPGPGD